jgi:hypothetical protein
MRRLVLCGLLTTAAMIAAPAQADIISAAGLQDFDAENVDVVSTTAGATVIATPTNATAKAQTDYGVNRIYNSSSRNDDGETYATSVWGETFTAQGSGLVNISMSFTIDGSVDYGPGGGRDMNYFVSALRGSWELSAGNGYDDVTARLYGSPQFFTGFAPGAGTQVYTGFYEIETDTADQRYAFYGTAANGRTIDRQVERDGSTFIVSNTMTDPYMFTQQTLTSTSIQDGSQAPLPYAIAPALGTMYQSMVNNYPILGRASLCSEGDFGEDSGCQPGEYPPSTLTLAFSVMAGSQFTIISALSSENADGGTVDFFNTVRLSDITVTGGSIATDNAQFQDLGNGKFGFTPAIAAVPEPATWAMLLFGFGMVGAGLRSSRTRARINPVLA